MKTLLVCGGREYDDRDALYKTLDELVALFSYTHLAHGDAEGADALADDWAKARGFPCALYPAPWDEMGNRAGNYRNEQMLRMSKPAGVAVFMGGTGTVDMATRAFLAGIQRHLVLPNRQNV